jgi:quinol monooxygenase YgiN
VLRASVLLLAACGTSPRAPANEPAIPARDAAQMVGGLFRFHFKPDKIAEARAYFGGQTARVMRDEPGTLALVWFEMSEPGDVGLFEVYADRPTLDAHNAKPEMTEVRARFPELTDVPTTKAYSLVEPGIGFVRVGGEPMTGAALVGTARRLTASADLDAKLARVIGEEKANAPDVLVDVAFHTKKDPTVVIGLEIFRDAKARDAHRASDDALGGEVEHTGPSFLGFVR